MATGDYKASNPKGNARNVVASPAQVTDLVMREAQRRGITWFKPYHAAGMVGSFRQETGDFRADVLNFTVRGDDGSAHGLMQWRGKRYQNLLAYAQSTNRNPTDISTQIGFAFEEGDSSSQYSDFGSVKAFKEFQTAKNVQETALSFIHAERSAGYDGNTRNAHDAESRIGLASKSLMSFGDGRSGGSGGGGADSGQYASYEDSLIGSGANSGGTWNDFNGGGGGTGYSSGGRNSYDSQNQQSRGGFAGQVDGFNGQASTIGNADRFGLQQFINDKSNNPFLAGKNTVAKSPTGQRSRFSAFGGNNYG